MAAIAVSGGADSFALLHWAWKAGHPIVALTVDHGLREGSAAEAQAVRTFCSERNIPHETLVWRGEKPKTGIQEAARGARYRLLCQACERLRIKHLLTAHTADDQAETVFMRLRRGAGRGLAGMPRTRNIAAGPGDLITLHRPLLDVRRATLRAYAEEAGLPFVDDPSNDDDKYERVRVRALLAALEQQGLLSVEALCLTANRMGLGIKPLPRVVAAEDGAVPFADVGDFQTILHDEREAMDRIVGAIGSSPSSRPKRSGEPGSISSINIRRAEHPSRDGSRISAGALSGMTVETSVLRMPETAVARDGVLIAPLGPIGIVFMREPAALLGRSDRTPGFTPVPTEPGSKHLYDRRFIVSVPDDVAPETHLRPLGQLIPRDIVTSTLARQRISTLPCLARGEQLTHLPEQAVPAVTKALAGWKPCDSFLPSPMRTFPARSLLAERFAGDVIRF